MCFGDLDRRRQDLIWVWLGFVLIGRIDWNGNPQHEMYMISGYIGAISVKIVAMCLVYIRWKIFMLIDVYFSPDLNLQTHENVTFKRDGLAYSKDCYNITMRSMSFAAAAEISGALLIYELNILIRRFFSNVLPSNERPDEYGGTKKSSQYISNLKAFLLPSPSVPLPKFCK